MGLGRSQTLCRQQASSRDIRRQTQKVKKSMGETVVSRTDEIAGEAERARSQERHPENTVRKAASVLKKRRVVPLRNSP